MTLYDSLFAPEILKFGSPLTHKLSYDNHIMIHHTVPKL